MNSKKFPLSNEELKTISEDKMSTNESINFAQNIFEEQFPQISGLFDTIIEKIASLTYIETPYTPVLHLNS